MNNMNFKYLIIGNSAGGITAAETIRRVDKHGALAILSEEPFPAYSRPMISEYLAGKCSLEGILYRPADLYEKSGFRFFPGKKAVKIDTAARTCELESGELIRWEKLLLATGGQAILPGIEGINSQGVFTFITLSDAKAIDGYLKRGANRAVVLGGGLIGVSVTDALVKRGVQVTIIEMKSRLLNTVLDEEGSAMVEARLNEAGVRIITGHSIRKIWGSPEKGVTGVNTDDGRNIPCDMVIAAAGVRPRVELAAGAGLKIARGIMVDRYAAASADGVYACGDAAEVFDYINEDHRPIPVWPNACLGGRIAGLNMAGIPAEYSGCTAMNSLKYFGLAVVSAGIVSPEGNHHETLSLKENGNYRKVVLKNGRIQGLVFAGDIERAGIVFNLMKDRVDISGFKEALVNGDFGLMDVPGEFWRGRFKAGTPGR